MDMIDKHSGDSAAGAPRAPSTSTHLKRADETLRIIQQSARDAEARQQRLRSDLAQATRENEDLSRQLRERDRRVSVLEEQASEATQRAETAGGEVEALRRQIAQRDNAVAGFREEIDALRADLRASKERERQSEDEKNEILRRLDVLISAINPGMAVLGEEEVSFGEDLMAETTPEASAEAGQEEASDAVFGPGDAGSEEFDRQLAEGIGELSIEGTNRDKQIPSLISA